MKNKRNETWILLRKLYSDKPLKNGPRVDLIKEAKEEVFAYVWDKMRKYGETCPPFIEKPQESPFVKAQGVREILELDGIENEGYLLRENGHFVIVVKEKEKLGETRFRTVIAHELGHTFFFDGNHNPIYPYSGNISSWWPDIEGPALDIGRQILVPKQSLPESIKSAISIKSFNKLRRKYNVSKHIMAFRLINDLRLWDAYIFITEYDPNIGKIKLPKNNERFRGVSFKKVGFSLNKNWNEIANDVLKKSIISPGEIIPPVKKEIGRYHYKIGAYSRTGLDVLCLIKPL